MLHSCLSTAPSGCRVRCSQELSGSDEINVFFSEIGDKGDPHGLIMSVVNITRGGPGLVLVVRKAHHHHPPLNVTTTHVKGSN